MNKDDLFVDLYNHLRDKITDKFMHTFDQDFEIIKVDKTQTSDYLEMSYIDENNLTASKCVKYKAVKDYVVLFDAATYLDNILKSYKHSSENIWEQFDKDLPRTDIYINQTKIEKRDQFLKLLDKFNKIDYNNHGLITLCALLCNQSSYALPYILMTKVHAGDMTDTLISNIADDRNIHIEIGDVVKFKFNANFGIKNIKTGDIKEVVKINLELSLNLQKDRDGNYILKNKEFVLHRYGVISWTLH
jgi:hypothetical protein